MDRVGPYEILEPLGDGRFVARRVDTGWVSGKLALTLIALTGDDDVFMRRAVDEASIACRFAHANVARIYELGIAADHAFVASELVVGATAAALPALPLPIATAIVAGACAGLHYLHECAVPQGPLHVVHRAVSPSTIAVGVEGSVKLLDAGLAPLLPPRSGAALPYLSPEQCLGRRLDGRSDVYALGSVLWELTVGRPRLPPMGDFEILHAIAKTDAVPPRSVVASYPLALDHIVSRALQRDPARRYPTMDEMHAELDALPQASPRQLAAFVRAARSELAASSHKV